MPVIFHSHLTESVDPVVDFTVDPSKTVWIDSHLACQETKSHTPLSEECEDMAFQHIM